MCFPCRVCVQLLMCFPYRVCAQLLMCNGAQRETGGVQSPLRRQQRSERVITGVRPLTNPCGRLAGLHCGQDGQRSERVITGVRPLTNPCGRLAGLHCGQDGQRSERVIRRVRPLTNPCGRQDGQRSERVIRRVRHSQRGHFGSFDRKLQRKQVGQAIYTFAKSRSRKEKAYPVLVS